MNEKQLVKQLAKRGKNPFYRVKDGVVQLSAPAVMLLALDAMYDGETVEIGVARATETVERLLAVARRHGFVKSDVLLALAKQRNQPRRVAELVLEALAGSPLHEVIEAIGPMGDD